ncbi:DUF2500 domain-containing protein [Intrasporangium flavum]|uniref:DUF2500 domain-containing protein n=1 Tax=Intrasporangium flavum TaxID=1428657 RepID=UPI001A96A3A4|nr:DUF2500 domain-containing protein [Intrasporangium flavum]
MLTDDFVPFDPAMTGPPTGFFLFFGLVAALVVAGIGYTLVKGISQWRADEASPLRSVDALVVSRRTDVRRHTRTDARATSTSTYYVTFEEDSGQRRELQVSGSEYGQLAEGDRGHLIHQGSRYKGFTRAAVRD